MPRQHDDAHGHDDDDGDDVGVHVPMHLQNAPLRTLQNCQSNFSQVLNARRLHRLRQ